MAAPNLLATLSEFDPVIYPYKLWVIVNKSPDIIADIFNEYDGAEVLFHKYDTHMMGAFTMPVMRKSDGMYGVVLFFRGKKDMTFQLVAHEASHGAKYLFEHINSEITQHEPFEYVVGWIAKCCGIVKSNKLSKNEHKMQQA